METASLSLAQPQTFGSTEETARGIAPILKQGFGLPLPKRVNVFVYLGRLAFERGLVVEEGLSQARAAELSDFAIGIAGRRELLLNQGGSRHTAPRKGSRAGVGARGRCQRISSPSSWRTTSSSGEGWEA